MTLVTKIPPHDYLTPDCMQHVFRLSDRYPAPLALVCKVWREVLENFYPLIATFYRKDDYISPFYSPVMTAEGTVDTKETVKQAYLRIMEFIDAPHIKKALQESGLQVVTPLAPSLSPIFDVARNANLVESFKDIFQYFTERKDVAFYQYFQQALAASCDTALIPRSTFEVGPAADGLIQPSLASSVLCVNLFVQNNPEILNQKELPIYVMSRNITALPLEVCLFINVTILNLSHNKLTTLPDAIGQLSKLEQLLLINNKFKIFPEIICSLNTLSALNFRRNELTCLPAKIRLLSHLEALTLSENKFNVFPKIICSLNALQHLYLDRNALTDLPETISLLSALEFLNLRYNQLTHLPQGTYALTNLLHLNIRNNKVNTIELKAISEQLSLLPQFRIDRCTKKHPIESTCSVQ
jgi:Leucine-rich repeat (LRR) protein